MTRHGRIAFAAPAALPVEVADKRNFRAAAEASFVTQSTLSAGIKELETLLVLDLVERDPRGVRLTPAGEKSPVARAPARRRPGPGETARGAGAPLSDCSRLGVIPRSRLSCCRVCLPP